MQIFELKNNSFDKKIIKDLLGKKICFIGVFSKLCIHCKNMKPQWEFLKNKLKKINCNGVLLEIDADQLNYIDYSSLNNSINGFPSLMVFKKGEKIKEYYGNRTSNSMFKFFKPYLIINKTKKQKVNLNKVNQNKVNLNKVKKNITIRKKKIKKN